MKLLRLLPGVALAVGIAAIAWFIESIIPIHVVGAAVIAMFIGMIVNHFIGKNKCEN